MKKRIAVIGAGLCGSLLATLLRNKFHVTVIEQGRRKRPLYDDLECQGGEVSSSINRAEGLGGTTSYWHNALIELADADLRKAGIDRPSFDRYHAAAWSLFLSSSELRECNRIRDTNRAAIERDGCSLAHMVFPRTRANLWKLANARNPGDAIDIVYGRAEKVLPGDSGSRRGVLVGARGGTKAIEADYVLLCAGGLSTPVLLSRSLGEESAFCGGYHDHPMAYVAKVRLRPDSRLKTLSCTTTASAEVRAGFVFETGGLKTAAYLRPAMNLKLSSITGPARYILSDLRNDPFSPWRILQVLSNPEALREAVLFKTKAGFRGDFYWVLLLGEQAPIGSRGIALSPERLPVLNWHVTDAERRAYQNNFERFLAAFSSDIVDANVIPTGRWEFRNAAHHSGPSARFLPAAEGTSLDYFSVTALPGAFVCDGSLLRASGIANSGLTLLALAYRLAELVAGLA